MSRNFQKRVEDFVCGHCGASIKGNGYTNHCPRCLWSKHVDVMPGDRAAECHGLMRPIGLESKGAGHVLIHRCERCGYEKRNRTSRDDDMKAIIALAKSLASH